MNIFAIIFLCLYGIVLLRGIYRLGQGNKLIVQSATSSKAGATDLTVVLIGVPLFLLAIGIL